ncbi:hypothetical protein dsx2_1039 [Desulfovibrio sp. X2]|uniref:carboxymuconolactone decarboxylase family protein n=1 Tax=Desulfovibrio sp. X2 TaxID=941449 RepID=UPI000358EFEE|nr:hypothetical protein [Desulfovibrio sp. X2]EPR37096.1 hypothetical protein dsx2_1039 [Desulfovibrio sp. X2]
MFLLDTQTRETAQGTVAEIFNAIPAQIDIPVPLQLMSASPGLMERQMQTIGYFRGHDRLSPALLASIRYVVSERIGYAPCSIFNAALLRAQGMSEAEIASLSCKPSETPLDETEAALLAFVTKSMEAPESVTRADIDALIEMGWRQSDILDAATQASNMMAAAHLNRVFVRP